jgi:hypothetical protein
MSDPQLSEKIQELSVTNRALNETNRVLTAEIAHLRRQFNAMAARYATDMASWDAALHGTEVVETCCS